MDNKFNNSNLANINNPRISLNTLDNIDSWSDTLQRIGNFDFYHLPKYHLIAEQSGEGKAMLFVYEEGSNIAAWPFLIRQIDKIPGLENIGSNYYDATSVYGYPGPVCSENARSNTQFLNRFHKAFKNQAKDLHIVSIFSRLNPVIENIEFVEQANESIYIGDTVIIDLMETEDLQFSKFRKNYRYEIRKSLENGMHCYLDQDWKYYITFQELYSSTMERVGASKEYFFTNGYFDDLREALGSNLKLFVAEKDGNICSSALFVRTANIVQYHLSGSDLNCGETSASKVVINEARIWSKKEGAKFLHLGGGVGAKQDSLYSFKRGFSNLCRKFYVYKHIVLPDMYSNLVDVRSKWFINQEQKLIADSFFPLYRSNNISL